MTARNGGHGPARLPRVRRADGTVVELAAAVDEVPAPLDITASLPPLDVPTPRPNPQLDFELALMAALGLEGRNDVLRMTLDVQAGTATATVVLAAPVLSRAALAGELPPIIMRFKLVPAGDA